MSRHDIIVIGASAGGVEALTRFVSALPSELPASLFIVLHIPANSTSVLPQILSRNGMLPAHSARTNMPIEPGHIYVAPPDAHLLIARGYLQLSREVRENGFRPAIDPLFRSAARTYGRRVVGVILSGTLDDGTAGLAVIKAQGGIAMVQSPEEALFPFMPQNAIQAVEVDYVLPVVEIASTLNHLARTKIDAGEETMQEELDRDEARIRLTKAEQEQGLRDGAPSLYTCPDCGGVLWEISEGDNLHYRCHVGHAYSADSLFSHQGETLEAAIWAAVRALEERASLCRRLATRVKRLGQSHSEQRFQEQAEDAHQRAQLIRQVLLMREESDTRNISDLSAEIRPPAARPPS
jgi:two-component system chemotaxis response regulator CheB